MSSADAFPYTVNPIKPKHDQYLLRGKRAQFAHHDLADAAGLVEGYNSMLRATAGRAG